MMIVSAKLSKRKLLLGLLAAVAVIVLLVVLLHASEEPTVLSEPVTQTLDGTTNEDRIAFLQSFGWQVAETPTETQEVRIPEEFNEVFTRYNQLQQSQGFDLNRQAGKAAKRYVYAITNYPGGSSDCCATVLVHKNKIIGGDVTCRSEGGNMHGFAMPTPTAG